MPEESRLRGDLAKEEKESRLRGTLPLDQEKPELGVGTVLTQRDSGENYKVIKEPDEVADTYQLQQEDGVGTVTLAAGSLREKLKQKNGPWDFYRK